jgi:hypothetical protein
MNLAPLGYKILIIIFLFVKIKSPQVQYQGNSNLNIQNNTICKENKTKPIRFEDINCYINDDKTCNHNIFNDNLDVKCEDQYNSCGEFVFNFFPRFYSLRSSCEKLFIMKGKTFCKNIFKYEGKYNIMIENNVNNFFI